jgi:tRNA pseudouridine55 synthase
MILNINKPINWTSNDVVRKVKSLLKVSKVGHAGTLDPLATGVLIILTDMDTKKQAEFMEMQKEYIFEMALGVASETYDMEGPISLTDGFTALLDEAFAQLTKKETLETAFAKYTGKFQQRVPAYSAVKVKGKPLYKYARAKKEATSPQKEVEIYSIEILEIVSKKEILIMGKTHLLPHMTVKVTCGKGTYIRSLAHDVGQDLKIGATVTKLVRTKIGPYFLENSLDLDSIKNPFSRNTGDIKNANIPAELPPNPPK